MKSTAYLAALLALGSTATGAVAQTASQSGTSIVAIELKVTDYAKWRSNYDSAAAIREKGGITSSHVYRSADDPNTILVWDETKDPAKTRDTLTSPEMKNTMQQAGVIGPPKIYVLRQ